MSKAEEILKKKKFFRDAITKRLPEEDLEEIWADARERMDKMFADHPNLPAGVSRHTDTFIFPAAAIYLAIKEKNADCAYAIMEETMKINSSKVGAIFRKLAKIPGFKRLFLKMWDPVSHKMFGESSGFRNTFYPKQKNEYRMDILECPYKKYLTELGCPELTVLFCKNDEYSYGNIEGMDFIRTQTLGAGGEKCDFRMVYRK